MEERWASWDKPRRSLTGGVGSWLASRVGIRAVCIGTGVYAVVFSTAAVLRHESFATHRFDLGDMTQAVWSTAHGRFLETTATGGDQFVRLGVHVDPLLAVFALPWRIWPSPLLLLLSQAIVVSLGALPVYWLARKHLAMEPAATCFAFAYLLYPVTQWNALNDFHPVSLAIPFLLFAIWYLDEDRLVPFVAFAILAGLTKEDIPLLIAGLGVWYALRRGRRLVGAAIAASTLGWFAVDVYFVLPHFAPPNTNLIAERYASVGGSPAGIIGNLVSDPVRIFDKAVTPHGFAFVLLLLLPFAGLSLREPILAACALPALGICLLSDKAEQTSIAEHYTAGIAPFVVASAVLGAASLGRKGIGRWSVVVLAAAGISGLFSPLFEVPTYAAALRSPVGAARADAIALVPPTVPVATTNDLGAHLSARRRIFSVPTLREARWIVVDLGDPTVGDRRDPAAFRRFLQSIESDARWHRVFARDGVFVFHAFARRGARSNTTA